jgi:hypothetical protein
MFHNYLRNNPSVENLNKDAISQSPYATACPWEERQTKTPLSVRKNIGIILLKNFGRVPW